MANYSTALVVVKLNLLRLKQARIELCFAQVYAIHAKNENVHLKKHQKGACFYVEQKRLSQALNIAIH